MAMDYFVYDLPFKERTELVNILNTEDAWYELGGHCLGYDITHLSNFRTRSTSKRGETPADLLLIHWGQKNRTVGELFIHLSELQLYQAMSVLKDYVPKNLHKFFEKPCQIISSAPLIPTKTLIPPPIPYNIPQSKYVENNLNHTESKSCYKAYRHAQSIAISKPQLNMQSCSSWVPSKNVKMANPTTNKVGLNIPPNTLVRVSSPGEGTIYLPGSSSIMKRGPSGLPVNESGVWLNEVSFEELKSACNNFDMECNLLGRGGFGEVYRGIWNGQEVAVKRIREDKRKVLGSEEFEKCISQMIMELRTLMSFPARNILPLMAYSYDETFKTDPCLVYQLMANGSLADRLRRKNNTDVLTWEQRISIATGTARGLVYLHANQITHVDIKSPNILLDEYLEPKIGDFGLVRWLDQSAENSYRIVSSVQGTAPYLPDDYIRSKQLSPAVDTFCFGIVLFELITAKSPSWQDPESKYRMRDIMLKQNCNLKKWIDPKLAHCGWSQSLFIIGQLCAVSNRRQRPEMKQVFEALKKLSEFNSPPNYGINNESDASQSKRHGNMTEFTNHMSECLSGVETDMDSKILQTNKNINNLSSANIPLILQGQSTSHVSSLEPTTSNNFVSSSHLSSSFREETTNSLSKTNHANSNIHNDIQSGQFNIPHFSNIINSDIPNLSNLRIDNEELDSQVESNLIPDLSILAIDNGIPSLEEFKSNSLNATGCSQKPSILNKLKQMDNIDDNLCSSKLSNIQISIEACQNIEDIL
uniref:non-specific serine/threonine protein kinase n=1 Tax=Lepeophtheirus salmonis TaxID=72036 RepID=A0A0K2U2G1_LEPSM